MKKRFITIALTCALVLTSTASAITASALQDSVDTVTYYSNQSDYVATKISHPSNGSGTPDGLVDYVGNGVVTDQITNVGDRAQNYSWSAQGYGDYIYIGTCANAMLTTLEFMKTSLGNNYDAETMEAAMNAMFNGHFFVGEEDGGDPKGILVKLNTKTGEVKLLMSKATTDTNVLFRNAVTYKDKIYFCGSVNGTQSVYEVNPENDEIKCVYTAMTPMESYQAYLKGISSGIRGMCVFNDQLIISINGLEGAYIAASSDPSAEGSFKVVGDVEDMFNYPAYHYYDSIYGGSVWDMIEYNNSLYVSLCTGTPDNKPDDNTMQSFALIRADVDEEGNWSWTSVAGSEENNSRYTFGIDPERTRSGAANLMVYGDYLYIGEYNDEEIALEDIIFSMNCDFVNANLEQSVNLYRMNENEDVELVMGDADEMFPEGSLTGYGSGFDRNENQYIWRMQEFDGKLYISTFDTSSLLQPIGQFTNGDIFKMSKEEWASQINYIKVLLNIAKSKAEQPEEEVKLASSLTDKQKKSAVSFANDEDAFENVDGTVIEDAIDINEILASLEAMLDEQVSEEFLEQLEQAYNELAPIIEQLPETLKAEFASILSSENIENIKSFLKCGYYLSTADRGFDLYVLDEDMNVETITTDGFDDPYNHGGRVFAVNNSGLSLGTANPFYGTQIWNITEMESWGSDYDLNGDGFVNVIDVTYGQRVLAEVITGPDYEGFGDLNGDGEFTINDITSLQYYLAEDF